MIQPDRQVPAIAVTMRVLGKQSMISIDHVSIERQATVPVVGDYPAV
jgi:hypothetical protein